MNEVVFNLVVLEMVVEVDVLVYDVVYKVMDEGFDICKLVVVLMNMF